MKILQRLLLFTALILFFCVPAKVFSQTNCEEFEQFKSLKSCYQAAQSKGDSICCEKLDKFRDPVEPDPGGGITQRTDIDEPEVFDLENPWFIVLILTLVVSVIVLTVQIRTLNRISQLEDKIDNFLNQNKQ